MTFWDVLKSDTMQQAYRVEEYRVRRMIKLGKLGPDDCIRRSGEQSWIRVADVRPSMWRDPLPTKDEQRRIHRERKQAKPATPSAKAPAPPEVEKSAESSPVAPAVPQGPPPLVLPPQGTEPDPFAATVHVAMPAARLPADLPTAHQAFEVGPAKASDSNSGSRRRRIAAPPVRRTRREDDDETPFSVPRKRRSEDLDLTAMVDVVFLLILFFMVTTTFAMQKSIQFPPPPPEEQAAQQAPTLDDLRDDNIVLDVLADNTVLLNDRAVSLVELADMLRREVRDTGLNEVVVRAAGEAYHETVVAVFDAANEVGVQRIRLANPAASGGLD